MGRPFAVFDIDGTLIRWQLYHALADELARSGLIDESSFAHVRDARMNWKNRRSATSFSEYELVLVTLIDRAISDISVQDVRAASQRVIDRYKDQVYTYTRDLMVSLRAKNYLLFALSASQADIVGLLAEYYHFDDFGASEYASVNGRYTGQKTVLKRQKKPEYLKRLVAEHGADWHGSIGVGDSESDIPMLATVERPIAFNPTQQLFEYALAHKWKVVIERKNMIYPLQPEQGGYRLEQETL